LPNLINAHFKIKVKRRRRVSVGLWLIRLGCWVANLPLEESESDWESGQLPASGTWCWVSDGKSVWIAKHDDHDASHGWTNEDCWEDWDGSVTHWIPLEMPVPPDRQEP
jgi:hypothetical protein